MNVRARMERILGEEKNGFLSLLGEIAVDRGCRIYLVGGAVRDLLRGGEIPDMDILVEGDAEKFASAAARKLRARKTARHDAFGTATIETSSGLRVDIATARTESYSRPGALPDVRPASMMEDLKRRDFSINAMAVSLMAADFGEITDPFRGAADLESGLLRILHSESFIDDPTRILRGVRFAARFGFSLEKRTLERMKKALSEGCMDTVSGARLKKEILMMMEERERGTAISLCREYGVDEAICRGFRMSEGMFVPVDKLRESISVLYTQRDNDAGPDDSLSGLAASAMNVGAEIVARLAARLDLSSNERAALEGAEAMKVCLLMERLSAAGITPADAADVLEAEPPEVIACVHAMAAAGAKKTIETFVKTTRGISLEISGRDLEEMGFRPGPEMGRVLREVLRMKRNGEVSGRRGELQAAGKLMGD